MKKIINILLNILLKGYRERKDAERVADLNWQMERSIDEYLEKRAEMRDMEQITFGEPIKVMLVTDKLDGCAYGIREYLLNSVDISALVVHNAEEAKEIVQNEQIDILIIVGVFRDIYNFVVIDEIRKIVPCITVVFYAADSKLSQGYRETCNLANWFDRERPTKDFIKYLQSVWFLGDYCTINSGNQNY